MNRLHELIEEARNIQLSGGNHGMPVQAVATFQQVVALERIAVALESITRELNAQCAQLPQTDTDAPGAERQRGHAAACIELYQREHGSSSWPL
jgi:hypothetical protein